MDKSTAEKLKGNQDKKPDKSSPPGPTEDQRIAAMEARIQLLQGQLEQKKNDEEETRLLEQAEKLKQERAQLEEEANLQKILNETMRPDKSWAVAAKDAGFDELDPKEMVSIIGDAVGKAINADRKLRESQMAELIKKQDEKHEATQRALVQLMASLTVKDARSQFKDFDEYQDDVSKILAKTGGSLSPEDAYLLAKAQRSSKTPAGPQVESERPGSSLPGPSSEDRARGATPSEEATPQLGRNRIFRDAVNAAIEKTIADRAK